MPTRPDRLTHVRLTKSHVDTLKPATRKQAFLRDTELKGFAVRVTDTGAKSFILEKRINGKSRRITLGAYPDITVEQARRKALDLASQIAHGIDPAAEKEAARAREITLIEAFDDFKRTRKNLKASTLYDYERLISVAFQDWQNKPLIAISKDLVQRRHTKLGTERGPAYANLAMRFLRSVLNFAMDHYEDRNGEPVLADNPVNRLTRTKAWYRVARRRTVIKTHELPAWFQSVLALKVKPEYQLEDVSRDSIATSADIADYLLLLLFTGLRREEGASLIWDQIDLKDRTLVIPDPKNHQPLTLPLSDFLVDLLTIRKAQAQDRARSPYVFPSSGKRGYLTEPKRTLAKIKEASGVTFTLHDLRRTFITIAESLDISPYAIKALVNHSTSGDVTAGYIVSGTERLRGPMQQITDFLKQAGKLD